MNFLISFFMILCIPLSANIHTVDPLSYEEIMLTPQGIYFSQGGETYFAHYLLYMGNGNYVAGLRHCDHCGQMLNENGDCENGHKGA